MLNGKWGLRVMGQADSGRVWSAWKCDAGSGWGVGGREYGRPYRGEDTSEGSAATMEAMFLSWRMMV